MSEKSSGPDEVSARTVKFLKIVSQNTPLRLHLSAYSFQKISGSMSPDPPRKLSGTRDFSPKREILDRTLSSICLFYIAVTA